MIREFNLAKMSRSKSGARKTAEPRFFFLTVHPDIGLKHLSSFPGGR
jgi:hypothetical protein